jgi:3-hydroxyisobutyrate dehydrogenase
MTDLAVLGTGRMGSAIAARLVEAGHHVTVWNRDPRKADISGTTKAATPAEAVAGATVVITMLTDGPAVRATLDAADVQDGTTIIQMSTVGPEETREIAKRWAIVDAPVGGSVDAARAGGLVIFASGPDAAVAKAEPVLDDLGTIKRVADGSAAKLVVNTAMVTALAALHDTLAVAKALGVDAAILENGPLGAALKRAASTTADFPVALAAKDLRLTNAQPEPDAKAEPEAGARVEPEAGARAEPEAGAKAEPESGAKAEPESGVKAERKAGANAEPKSQARTQTPIIAAAQGLLDAVADQSADVAAIAKES